MRRIGHVEVARFRGGSCLKGSFVQRSILRWAGNTMENRFWVLTPKATWLPLNSRLLPASATLVMPRKQLSPESAQGPLLFLGMYSQCHSWDTQYLQLSSAGLFPNVPRLPCVSANKSRLPAPKYYSKSPGGLTPWMEHCWAPHHLQ